ncbi:HlyD family secretion protein [Acinetobacter stercoris]
MAIDDLAHLKKRKKIAWIIFSLLLFLLLIGILYYFFIYRFTQITENAYVQSDLTWIMPKISGEVLELKIKENQFVKKGQILAIVDHQDYQAKYDQALSLMQLKQAALIVQDENEKSAHFSIQEAESNLYAAQAELDRLGADYKRYKQLLMDGVITRQRFETIKSQYVSAQAQLYKSQAIINTAKSQLASIQASRIQLLADIDNAKAAVNLYQVDVLAAQIKAPVSGTVGNLSIRKGSRVNPQSRLLAIIPEHSLYIEANFKETQIEKMHKGQKVNFTLDAYPGIRFTGKIESFSPASGSIFSMMPSDNATGNFNKVVQRIPVRISIDPHPHIALVKPGLSVIAKVDLKT